MFDFEKGLKKVRKELNISQEQLARELHVSFSTVNRWENKKSNPNNIAKKAFADFCKKKNISMEGGEE